MQNELIKELQYIEVLFRMDEVTFFLFYEGKIFFVTLPAHLL